MNYSVSSLSPTEELLTVGRILSEVGRYASTILDSKYLSISQKCQTRYDKIVNELISRKTIKSEDGLYDLPQSYPMGTDLARLTISELYDQYRCWPLRHKERETEGRENFTFYYEGRIVRELKRRKVANRAEQLKIDYCVATYHNELDNMSFLFSRPVQLDNDKIYPDSRRVYTPDELTALIRLYKHYRDIAERELLVEYVDYALNRLAQTEDSQSSLNLPHTKCSASYLGLLTEIAEIGRKKIIRIPAWVNDKLKDTVTAGITSKTAKDADLAPALLTLQIIDGDSALERKAKRLVNRCYRSAFDDNLAPGERIDSLHTAVTCCDYVSRFSVRKVARLWNELSSRALAENESPNLAMMPNKVLTSAHIFRLMEIARECEGLASISTETKEALRQNLKELF